MRKIKGLVLGFFPNKLTIQSKDGEITEFWKETEHVGSETRYSLWFKQRNYEINIIYVVEIEYEEE